MIAQGFGTKPSEISSAHCLQTRSKELQRSPGDKILSWTRRSWDFPRKSVPMISLDGCLLKCSLGFYLISIWYRREESQKRFTVYWCSVLTASAFGGLLASAIANMDGIRGLANWQWVFILEGIFTCLVAIAAFFLVSDFPEDAKWLTEEERAFVIERAGGNEAAQPITSHDLVVFFKDPKNLLGGVMYLGKTLYIRCIALKTNGILFPQLSLFPYMVSTYFVNMFCN